MKKAILFDLDGVLFNTEHFDQLVNTNFVKENNLKTNPKIFRAWVGSNPALPTWEEKIFPYICEEDDRDTFQERLHAYRAEKRALWDFSEMIFPESKGVVKSLKERGLLLACCSSSAPEYIDKALKQGEIKEYFDLIVSGRNFTNSKPAPDIYLYAMNYFKVTSDECLVIEDSPYGIKAGKNANITVLARRDKEFGMDQTEADYIIEDLNEIEKYL